MNSGILYLNFLPTIQLQYTIHKQINLETFIHA